MMRPGAVSGATRALRYLCPRLCRDAGAGGRAPDPDGASSAPLTRSQGQSPCEATPSDSRADGPTYGTT
eukprot:4552212-Prymnesium_polylepis.1